MGFGSDGASVMTGRSTGVGTRLHQSNPYLIAIHCVVHRLALACAQAGEKVSYVQKFKRALGTLYWFFQASAVRTAALKAIHFAELPQPQNEGSQRCEMAVSRSGCSDLTENAACSSHRTGTRGF